MAVRELYAYVWRASAPRQMVLIVLAIIAAVLVTAPPELQRHIINTLVGHEKFARLGWLCGGYLTAALGIGGLKYLVNIKSAGLGELMIRILREEVARLPRRRSPPADDPEKVGDRRRVGRRRSDVVTVEAGLGELDDVLVAVLDRAPRESVGVVLRRDRIGGDRRDAAIAGVEAATGLPAIPDRPACRRFR